MNANQSINVPGGRDTIGHSSVQGWSAGDYFPAVISIVESYFDCGTTANDKLPLSARLRWRAFEVLLDGRSERYASHGDAEAAARFAVANRAQWRAGE